MLAVGTAIVAGGGVQTYLLMAKGRPRFARPEAGSSNETHLHGPAVADQAILGEYAVISQLLNTR